MIGQWKLANQNEAHKPDVNNHYRITNSIHLGDSARNCR